MGRMGRAWIGTSGWSYEHWRGSFYPEALAERQWLGYYGERLASVEINNSFYRLPAAATLRAWARQVPREFRFALKASRYLTHMKKLKPAPDGLARLLERAAVLGRQLGPILFQLPPNWHANPARLGEFLDSLPGRFRYAFELRDESWWDAGVFDTLRRRGAATVWFDLEQNRSPVVDTAAFRYVRWHGPGAAAYTGRYGRNRLRPLARRVAAWLDADQDVYVYFDNDQAGHAPADAQTLRRMLGT